MRDRFSKTSKRYNLIGERFGRLLVLDYVGKNNYNQLYYLCECVCGNQVKVLGHSLLNGRTKSCGCYRKERSKQESDKLKTINIKHNLHNHKLYSIWHHMKDRCYNNNYKSYMIYGGRGIKVCDEWKNNFQAFYDWAISNGYEDSLTIDRINTDGNYEPSNCRWATYKQQQNNRRNNHYITYNGATHTLSQWSEILNINSKTLRSRLYMNWTIERAFTTPVKKRNK